MLYLWIFFRAREIFVRCGTAFPGLLVLGLALMITCQALLHVMVTVNLMPRRDRRCRSSRARRLVGALHGHRIGMILSVSRQNDEHSHDTPAPSRFMKRSRPRRPDRRIVSRDRRIDLLRDRDPAGRSGAIREDSRSLRRLFRWIYAFHMPPSSPFRLSVPLRRRSGREVSHAAVRCCCLCRVDDARLHPQGAVERLCHAAVGVEFFSLSARLSIRPTIRSVPSGFWKCRGESCGKYAVDGIVRSRPAALAAVAGRASPPPTG